MKRSLAIPAFGCVIAFASLYAVFDRAVGDEDDFATSYVTTSSRAIPDDPPTSPAVEAERMLDALRQTYQERRRAWAESPHRMFSRAAVTPVDPTQVEYALAPPAITQGSELALATLNLEQRNSTESIPCAIDPATNRIFLFHDGAWRTESQWLDAAAPLAPQERRTRQSPSPLGFPHSALDPGRSALDSPTVALP